MGKGDSGQAWPSGSPEKVLGGAALGVPLHEADQVYACGGWGSRRANSVSGLGSGPGSVCVRATWLLCIQEPSFVRCMKPLCFSLGFVFPERGRSSFEHSCSPCLIRAVPILPAFLPSLWVKGYPRGTGRKRSRLPVWFRPRGARYFGKGQGSSRKGFSHSLCPPSLGLML